VPLEFLGPLTMRGVSDEPVAPPVCSFDEPGLGRVIRESFPDLANADFQHSLADGSVSPNGSQYLGL